MKRQIKFRAWHVINKQMLWWDVMWGNHYLGNGFIGMVPWGEQQTKHQHRDNMILVDPYDCEIMQFTGLKDKNGREIYEGDIVRYYVNAPWDEEVPLEVKSEVVFDDPFYGCFCVKSMDGFMDATGCLYEYIDGIEVIGNIYENHELLSK